MHVEQFVSLGGSGSNINETFPKKAFRIAFQALPGTKFQILSENSVAQVIDENQPTITMGPTGIYELGFTNAIIRGFRVTEQVDNTMPMILDVLCDDQSDIRSNDLTRIPNFINYLLSEENYSGEENR